MHPTTGWLYVISANREMKTGNMAGARTMMERGIRVNGKDERLWIRVGVGTAPHATPKSASCIKL